MPEEKEGVCNYQFSDEKPCGRPLHDNEHCIFHSKDIKGKKENFKYAFWQEFERQKMRIEKYNFRGFVFPDKFLFVEDNLKGANFVEAELLKVYLTGANLVEADLRRVNLTGAHLREANLLRANLRDAVLRKADLREANLREANLRGADLLRANLREADLKEADLTETKGLTVEQLLQSKTLYKVRGLPPIMEEKLRDRNPDLLVYPILYKSQIELEELGLI